MKKTILIPAVVATLSMTGLTIVPAAVTSAHSVHHAKHVKRVTTKMKEQHIYLTVTPGMKLGPDGKLHDAFSPANFTLVEGVPAKITIYNYDNMKHSVTSSALGINFQANPSKKNGAPGVVTYSFTPKKDGTFTWQCIDPCDMPNKQWSMSHKGYMEGTIKVVPPSKAVQDITLTVMPGGKLGPDGKLHDAFSPANFTVEKGVPVHLTIYNYDNMKHSVTSSALGINFVGKPSKKNGAAGVAHYTFTPKKDGNYSWQCIYPCDMPNHQWSMSHKGFMEGTVHVE